MRIVVELPGVPIGKGRPKASRIGDGVRMYTPAKTAKYEARLAAAARDAMEGHQVLNEALAVTVLATMTIPKSWSKSAREAALAGRRRPTSKPDADNLLKILDAFNGIVWRDDAIVVEAHIQKCYGARPSLLVMVEAIGGIA